ncbi:MAG TPA: asparagine synthetase B, partial [candidate division Zixibacteria bacterium]|nr:asparagine synthetase B [candidate division Zixibacteria bacterium]
MCGITGFWIKNSGSSAESLRKTVKIMSDALVHRGPDDCGIWVDENNGLALGHRRLTVIDLSSAGSQPMKSADGRYIIIYNGEIYNYKEIAERLRSKGVGLRGGSDTEVLLEAISVWGVDDTLQQLVGMFAFAVWDRKKNILVLARDRMGEKPLYYGWVNNGFVFASELKAIKRYPG